MGNSCCKPEREVDDGSIKARPFKRPRWRSDEPLTEEELARMRDEFWDTEPHYGGDRVIWDALRAASAADVPTAKLIIESAGIIVTAEDMTICYDERGAKYELPKYVLSKPVNLVRNSKIPSASQESELTEQSPPPPPTIASQIETMDR